MRQLNKLLSDSMHYGLLSGILALFMTLGGCGGGGGGGTGGSPDGVNADNYVVKAGQTVTLANSATIQAPMVTIDGDLKADGKNGQSITIQSQGDVSISGNVSAGDGGVGQDGGSVTIVSATGKITITGQIKAGDGGSVAVTTSADGSSLPGADGGKGKNGGHIILRATQGSIAVGTAARLIHIGNGGKGADIEVKGKDLLSYVVPATLLNSGGGSGAIVLDSPVLNGLTTASVQIAADFPAQNPIYSKGSKVAIPTSTNVDGGIGGSAGSFRYGIDAKGNSTWPAASQSAVVHAAAIKATAAVSSYHDLNIQGAMGGIGVIGGKGANVNVMGQDGSAAAMNGQNVGAVGGDPGASLLGNFEDDGGGYAEAHGGNGAAGADPNQNGGDGGNAIAYGGYSVNVGMLGSGYAYGGAGGSGGNACPAKVSPGGSGGKGGNATAGGNSIDSRAKGGNGGNGGSGVYAGGAGGAGGVASSSDQSTPGKNGVPGTTCPPPKIFKIALGGGLSFSIASDSSGVVAACGSDQYGQLGRGLVPSDVNSTFIAINIPPSNAAAGGFSAFGDGPVYAWGANYFGNLGDGTTTNRNLPTLVSGIATATAVAGGEGHTLALLEDGSVRAWGNNGAGQLGTGTTVSSYTPVPVSGLANVTAVAAGGGHSLALKKDGTLWAWGSNFNGELGIGTIADSMVPVQVIGLAGVIAISAKVEKSLALKSDGTVWLWGGGVKTPAQVTGLSGVTAIAAGAGHYLALKGDGTVWAWGIDNSVGQMGDGTTTAKGTPFQITTLSGMTAIGAGYGHSLARKSDGTVWTWGNNASGQLGDGTTTNRSTPVQAKNLILN